MLQNIISPKSKGILYTFKLILTCNINTRTHGGREEVEDWFGSLLIPESDAPVSATAEEHIREVGRPLDRVHWALQTKP